MSKKTYCDRCKKEICEEDYKPGWYISAERSVEDPTCGLSPIWSIGVTVSHSWISSPDICKKCVVELLAIASARLTTAISEISQ